MMGPLANLLPFFLCFFTSMTFFVNYPSTKDSHRPIFAVFKVLPIICLLLSVLRIRSEATIIVGLVTSLIGDICLVYHERFFLLGVLSFGISQSLYSYAFGFANLEMWLLLPIAVAGISFWILVSSNAESDVLRVFLLVYMSLLGAMLWRAMASSWNALLTPSLRDLSTTSFWKQHIIAAGAVSFVVSDSLIALYQFRLQKKQPFLLIISLYYIGQAGISLMVLA